MRPSHSYVHSLYTKLCAHTLHTLGGPAGQLCAPHPHSNYGVKTTSATEFMFVVSSDLDAHWPKEATEKLPDRKKCRRKAAPEELDAKIESCNKQLEDAKQVKLIREEVTGAQLYTVRIPTCHLARFMLPPATPPSRHKSDWSRARYRVPSCTPSLAPHRVPFS